MSVLSRTASSAGVSGQTASGTHTHKRTAPTKINELLNSSFEQGVSGWTPYSPNGGTATVTQSDDYALFGDYSLKMVPNTDFQWFIRYTGGFAVSGLSTYTVSGYILSPIRSTFSQIAVYEFNSSGGVVGIQYGAINLVTTSSGWVRNRLTFTTRSATRNIWIQVSGSAKTGEAVYHDGYMIQTGSLVADWQPAELIAKGTETATGLHFSARTASGSGVGSETTTRVYVPIRTAVSDSESGESAVRLVKSVRQGTGSAVGDGYSGDVLIALDIGSGLAVVSVDTTTTATTALGNRLVVLSSGDTNTVTGSGARTDVVVTGSDNRVLAGV